MTAASAVSALVSATTAVTAIFGTRIYHGMQPRSQTLPNLTFYEVSTPARFNGIERQMFSFNCRAKTRARALEGAREIVDLFHGTASTGIYGFQGTFDIGRSYQDAPAPIIPEPTDGVYNVPVPIVLIYPSA